MQKINTRKLNDTAIANIKSDLDKHDWSELRELETNEAFDHFHQALLSGVDSRAPMKTKTILKGKLRTPGTRNK